MKRTERKQKRTIQYSFRSVYLLLFSAILMGCAPVYRTEMVDSIHKDPTFDKAVEDGRTLLVFPIIVGNNFITRPDFEAFISPLDLRHDRLEVSWYPEFFESVDDKERLKRVETQLIQGDVLEIPNYLDYFDGTDLRFLELFRVTRSFTIMDSTGAMEKHVTLEGEVWDVRKRGVVWRSSAVVETADKRVTDEKMLVRAIELLYETLPRFYFNSTEREW